MEVLQEAFADRLFFSSHPFTKRIVIVPSAAMKSYLTLQAASHPILGIAAGMEIGYVEPSLKSLYALVANEEGQKQCAPSELELCFALQSEMIKALCRVSQDVKIWEELSALFGIDTPFADQEAISLKVEKRSIALSHSFAKIFLDYGIFGKAILNELSSPLQEFLWHRMEVIFSPWHYPSRKYEECSLSNRFSEQDLQVHIFGLSYIAPLYHRFLLKVADFIPVSYYLISPCQKFWSDQLSGKERSQMAKTLKKRKVSEEKRQAMDAFIADTNPLLVNFGRLGKEMARQIEDADPTIYERYIISENIVEHPAYQELIDLDVVKAKANHPLKLLEAIQADITLLRNPEIGEKIAILPDDRSIQIHVAPKPIREVEAIYNAILSILDDEGENGKIQPSDIVVMVSNFSFYEPYIRQVFESKESLLPIQLMDVKSHSENIFIQAFLQLINLPFGRWESGSLLSLFSLRPFQNRHGLREEELKLIMEWIQETGIVWGLNVQHRNEAFKRCHCNKNGIDDSGSGTWENGIGSLLDELICGPSETDEKKSKIGIMHAELLGRLLHLIRSLQADLKPLSDGTKMTLCEWSAYLVSFCDLHLSCSFNEDDAAGKSILLLHLQKLSSASELLNTESYGFLSIKYHLEQLLNAEETSYKESNLAAIRFSSLLPMRALPAKVVVLMGMDDVAFAQKESCVLMNQLLQNPKVDYCPTKIELNRYLFLEALLSARRYFLLSYTSFKPGETAKSLPSLLISEFLSYLELGFCSHDIVYNHPFKSFHYSYFSKEARCKSYLKSQYGLASLYYNKEKKAPYQFLPPFLSPVKVAVVGETKQVSLSSLEFFAKNPLRAYFNQHLQIYIKNDDEILSNEEEALLMRQFDFVKWAREGIYLPEEQVLQKAILSPFFPKGPFSNVEKGRLSRQIDTLKGALEAALIKPTSPIAIEFNERHTAVKQTSFGWQVPPLKIELKGGKSIVLVGRIENLIESGCLFFDRYGVAGAAKIWPIWLVYCSLLQRDNLPLSTEAIFLKNDKATIQEPPFTNPSLLLSRYLEYYFQSIALPSPLMPDCIDPLLKGDRIKASAIFLKSDEFQFNETFDPYLKWIKRHFTSVFLDSEFAKWQQIAHELYGDLKR